MGYVEDEGVHVPFTASFRYLDCEQGAEPCCNCCGLPQLKDSRAIQGGLAVNTTPAEEEWAVVSAWVDAKGMIRPDSVTVVDGNSQDKAASLTADVLYSASRLDDTFLLRESNNFFYKVKSRRNAVPFESRLDSAELGFALSDMSILVKCETTGGGQVDRVDVLHSSKAIQSQIKSLSQYMIDSMHVVALDDPAAPLVFFAVLRLRSNQVEGSIISSVHLK